MHITEYCWAICTYQAICPRQLVGLLTFSSNVLGWNSSVSNFTSNTKRPNFCIWMIENLEKSSTFFPQLSPWKIIWVLQTEWKFEETSMWKSRTSTLNIVNVLHSHINLHVRIFFQWDMKNALKQIIKPHPFNKSIKRWHSPIVQPQTMYCKP